MGVGGEGRWAGLLGCALLQNFNHVPVRATPSSWLPPPVCRYFSPLVSLSDWSLWLWLSTCFPFGILPCLRFSVTRPLIFEHDFWNYPLRHFYGVGVERESSSGKWDWGEGHHNQVSGPSVGPCNCWLLPLRVLLRFPHDSPERTPTAVP